MFGSILRRLGRIFDHDNTRDSSLVGEQLLSGELDKDVAVLTSKLPSQNNTIVRTLEVATLIGKAKLADRKSVV